MKNRGEVSLIVILIILGILVGIAISWVCYIWWQEQYKIIEQGQESKEELQEIQKKDIEEKAKEMKKLEEERQEYMEDQFNEDNFDFEY